MIVAILFMNQKLSDLGKTRELNVRFRNAA